MVNVIVVEAKLVPYVKGFGYDLYLRFYNSEFNERNRTYEIICRASLSIKNNTFSVYEIHVSLNREMIL